MGGEHRFLVCHPGAGYLPGFDTHGRDVTRLSFHREQIPLKAIRRLAWRKRQWREEGRRGYQVSRDVSDADLGPATGQGPRMDRGWAGDRQRGVKEEEGEGSQVKAPRGPSAEGNGGTQGQGSVGNGEDGI